jgi:geranylgeranyl pyrophosphate synthase
MTDGRPKAVLSNSQLGPFPDAFQQDLERYLNQGGLLGTITYALVYLDTGDEQTAARAASIPTNLFVASCLHDDAIDATRGDGTGRKAFRNWRVTVGDVVYTRILDVVETLPEAFETATVTDQFRTIAYGQLDEESDTRVDPTMAEAVSRVEQRGSVWGELAVSPALAGGYGGTELDHVSAVVENVLFVLTLVDDVEDVPEDLENGVANIPVLVADADPADYSSTAAFVGALVDSDVPDRLADVVERHETEMETSALRYVDATDHTPAELLDALARALEWYREAACPVPLEETVPPDRQATVRERLAGDEADREAVLSELIDAFPLSIRDSASVHDTATEVPTDRLAPVVVGLFHVSALVDSAMTTDLGAALDSLQERAAAVE